MLSCACRLGMSLAQGALTASLTYPVLCFIVPVYPLRGSLTVLELLQLQSRLTKHIDHRSDMLIRQSSETHCDQAI